jgi:hypothetical protein
MDFFKELKEEFSLFENLHTFFVCRPNYDGNIVKI